MSPITRALANSLIDEHFSDGHGDAAADYAQHIPVRVIAQMIGILLDDEAMFTSWVVSTMQEGFENLANIPDVRLEERREGKECYSMSNARWSPKVEKSNKANMNN